ncbi:Threonine--tRNA ligase [Candidatus Kinetoplastibacterium sorsogonicusi]|uniref:Threonine--tRNA ligase n=1 Tax=Candidatus Kinetoplastidibacterium kentomonadis TaxID=1576550 RepID=A0A3S7J9J6_9PROT|nr:threonine--tRNA ligase [Candidatus Kinetoplastibacterium sorsogonicusi]AWD32340.1 Threonine--tRNA ligase [Candidatus Kinetoplastibacterium sorsogonicusi]
MIQITLHNGSIFEYSHPVTVSHLAHMISKDLFKKALGAIILSNKNYPLVDVNYLIKEDINIKIVTAEDPEGLDIIRHSTAHLLAYAVKSLFDDIKIAIGPTTKDGFFYDFSYKRSFTPDDLILIENKMKELAKKNEPIIKKELSREDAINLFESLNETYKVSLIVNIPNNEKITIYQEGDFIDLCKGPHVPSTGFLKVFKLTKISGAYWQGNSKNEMLQRIYGTAWNSIEDQNNYIHMLEEAEKRDHRKIGKELDLFHFQEEAPGLIFWHEKGWVIWQQIELYMRGIYKNNDYKEVKSPQIIDISLWKKTGHWDNYRENIFTTESENRIYGIKPMNCPGHIQIFKSKLHSYRELPIRYGEFGQCHRNESSGSLHGIMRVRGFTQDDGHIFCTPDQIQEECIKFTLLLQKVYRDFGFTDILYRVATRPKKKIGTDAIWDLSEKALVDSLKKSNCNFEIMPEDGAFYGPKIEYTLKDAIGRFWQCGTLQVDFSMPSLLGAEYIDKHDQRINPVIIHRAILGSFERFIGMLIEHYVGAMPTWLAPIQVVICCISDIYSEYVEKLNHLFLKENFRSITDLRSEKINKKIREHSLQKIPYILIIGEKEMNTDTVSVRGLKNLNLGSMSIEAFIKILKEDINSKRCIL